MKTEAPLHHQPASLPGPLTAGGEYPVFGSWRTFIGAVLQASDTIDARRAARRGGVGDQSAVVEIGPSTTKPTA